MILNISRAPQHKDTGFLELSKFPPRLLLKVWQIIVYTEDQKVIFIHNMQTEGATQGRYLGFS